MSKAGSAGEFRAARRWPARYLGLCLGLLAALSIFAGSARAAQPLPVVKLAVGGAGCLCYLPTVLAEQLGAYKA
ncbi:MAG: hypothetical protein ACREFV_12665, partial [Acetobacteraceae bacterium]